MFQEGEVLMICVFSFVCLGWCFLGCHCFKLQNDNTVANAEFVNEPIIVVLVRNDNIQDKNIPTVVANPV